MKLSNHKENTLKHVEDVADTAVWLAKVYNLDIIKVKLAAEEKYHFLLHQRISKIIAREDYDINDSDVLDAIECHTTLKKNASMYDKVIFIADKISWDQNGVPPYFDLLISKVKESLDEACYFYIKYQFEHDLLLMPHQWIKEAYEDLKIILKRDI